MDWGRFLGGVLLLSLVAVASVAVTTESGGRIFTEVVESVTDWLTSLVE